MKPPKPTIPEVPKHYCRIVGTTTGPDGRQAFVLRPISAAEGRRLWEKARNRKPGNRQRRKA